MRSAMRCRRRGSSPTHQLARIHILSVVGVVRDRHEHNQILFGRFELLFPDTPLDLVKDELGGHFVFERVVLRVEVP